MIMSAVVFLQPLPDAAQSKLQKKYMPKKVSGYMPTHTVATAWSRTRVYMYTENIDDRIIFCLQRQSFWSFWGRRGITDNEESLQEKV